MKNVTLKEVVGVALLGTMATSTSIADEASELTTNEQQIANVDTSEFADEQWMVEVDTSDIQRATRKQSSPNEEFDACMHWLVNDSEKEEKKEEKVVEKEEDPNLATLASFTAEAVNGKVILDWTTATEIENAGFLVWRGQSLTGQCSDNADDYTDIQQVGSWINTNSKDGMLGASYSYEDAGMVPGTTYYYALEDIDDNGKSTYHMAHIISVTVE
jgi:hypothetical protein